MIDDHPWKNGQGDVPFNQEGNQMSWADSWQVAEWKPNEEFNETLVFDGYGRGRSSAVLYFKGKESGRRYSMFMRDADDALGGLAIYGKWTFVKRGGNYGIKLADSPTTDELTNR